jgi:uncharacterized protein (DUF1330 family)
MLMHIGFLPTQSRLREKDRRSDSGLLVLDRLTAQRLSAEDRANE